jgi:hypothetical protein
MKKNIHRVALLLIVLSLGFAGPGLPSARAMDNVTMKPGRYKGTFTINAKSHIEESFGIGKVSQTETVNFELFMGGMVTLDVTSATQARAVIDVTQLVLNEQVHMMIHGQSPYIKERIDCDRSGILYENAEAIYLAALNDNYDPLKSAFRVAGSVSGFSNPSYTATGEGESEWEQCKTGVSELALTPSLESNAKMFAPLILHVTAASGNSIQGDIQVDNWISVATLTRTINGSWNAVRVPDRPAGLKRKGKK